MSCARQTTVVIVVLMQVFIAALGGAGARACFSCDSEPLQVASESSCSCCCGDELACPCCDPVPAPQPESKDSDCPSMVSVPSVMGEGLRIQTAEFSSWMVLPSLAAITVLPTPSELSEVASPFWTGKGPPPSACGIRCVIMLV
ncbi:MAG: hypothetical protein ACK54H_07080 [Phycisphaerales bacterium]